MRRGGESGMMQRNLAAWLAVLLVAGCGVSLPSAEPPGPEVHGMPATIGTWSVTLLAPDPTKKVANPFDLEEAADFYTAAGGSSANGAWALFKVSDEGGIRMLVTAYRVIGASSDSMWEAAFAVGIRNLSPLDVRPGGWDLRSDSVNGGWVAVRGDRLLETSGGQPGPTLQDMTTLLTSLP